LDFRCPIILGHPSQLYQSNIQYSILGPLGVLAVQLHLYFLIFLCSFVVKNVLVFAFSAECSRVSTATAQQWHGGGNTRAFRCACVNSAALAEVPAAQKCHFSGLDRASRLSFRRKK
jgi:hypothetical protein